MAVTINFKVLDDNMKAYTKRELVGRVKEIAQERFEGAKETFLSDFLSHPVSEEIQEGPRAESGSLEQGNLFGFLGFQADDDPIGQLYDFLNEEIQLKKTPKFDSIKGAFEFNVNIPSKEEIKDVTPMEWGTSRSWVFSIESGLPGLNHYIFSRRRELGRSTGGLQSKKAVSSGGYKAQRYMSDLLNQLKKNL